MNIVQISGAYVGAQRIIEKAIHEELKKRGHNSRILYSIGVSDDEDIECYDNSFSLLSRRVMRKFFGKNPVFSYQSTKRLIRSLDAFKPDLVHLHVLHQGYLDYEMLFNYLYEKNIPVVYTMHDMWAFTGGCYYYTKENCLNFQTGCKKCPANASRIDNPLNKTEEYFNLKKNLLLKLKRVQYVAVSQWVADEMKKSFLSEQKISVVDNGIDFVPFESGKSIEKKDGIIDIISVAATWDERKGIYRIFEIAQKLGEKYRIVLVGNASQNISYAAPKNVKFAGYVKDKAELLRMYSEADIHMSASFEETFGMTFIESAFVGTRSIGYDSSAITSTLEGVDGVIIKELTSNAMAEGIKAIVTNGNMKLSPEEVKKISDRYSSKTMAKKYCDIYSSFFSV